MFPRRVRILNLIWIIYGTVYSIKCCFPVRREGVNSDLWSSVTCLWFVAVHSLWWFVFKKDFNLLRGVDTPWEKTTGESILKGQSHEKVYELRVWGNSLV
jgi:hypothetical protein